jgi:hypothetical protein
MDIKMLDEIKETVISRDVSALNRILEVETCEEL